MDDGQVEKDDRHRAQQIADHISQTKVIDLIATNKRPVNLAPRLGEQKEENE